jgi:hypothetical protein
MALTIIEGERHFEMFPGEKRLPHPVRGRSQSKLRVHQWHWIVRALCTPQELFGNLIGRP